jgi:hypothetical protein
MACGHGGIIPTVCVKGNGKAILGGITQIGLEKMNHGCGKENLIDDPGTAYTACNHICQ